MNAAINVELIIKLYILRLLIVDGGMIGAQRLYDDKFAIIFVWLLTRGIKYTLHQF